MPPQVTCASALSDSLNWNIYLNSAADSDIGGAGLTCYVHSHGGSARRRVRVERPVLDDLPANNASSLEKHATATARVGPRSFPVYFYPDWQ